jgi:hypothetical protein
MNGSHLSHLTGGTEVPPVVQGRPSQLSSRNGGYSSVRL